MDCQNFQGGNKVVQNVRREVVGKTQRTDEARQKKNNGAWQMIATIHHRLVIQMSPKVSGTKNGGTEPYKAIL